jgi:hypothetical protein
VLWHIAVDRLVDVNEQLIRGGEDIYFGFEFATRPAKKLRDYAVRYYIDALASDPEALRGSFEFCRAFDTTMAENEQRETRRLTIPRPGDRRSGKRRWNGRGRDEAGRGRCANPRHPRQRPLRRRGGSRGDARGADRVPGPVPRRTGHGAQPQAGRARMSSRIGGNAPRAPLDVVEIPPLATRFGGRADRWKGDLIPPQRGTQQRSMEAPAYARKGRLTTRGQSGAMVDAPPGLTTERGLTVRGQPRLVIVVYSNHGLRVASGSQV